MAGRWITFCTKYYDQVFDRSSFQPGNTVTGPLASKQWGGSFGPEKPGFHDKHRIIVLVMIISTPSLLVQSVNLARSISTLRRWPSVIWLLSRHHVATRQARQEMRHACPASLIPIVFHRPSHDSILPILTRRRDEEEIATSVIYLHGP